MEICKHPELVVFIKMSAQNNDFIKFFFVVGGKLFGISWLDGAGEFGFSTGFRRRRSGNR